MVTLVNLFARFTYTSKLFMYYAFSSNDIHIQILCMAANQGFPGLQFSQRN